MKKIILTVAFVLSSGVAFAGSDHYGSDFAYGSGQDVSATTTSITADYPYTASFAAKLKGIGDAAAAPAAQAPSMQDMPAPGYGRGIWGR